MFVTYTPDGNEVSKQTWVFNPGRVRQSEAVLVEKMYGDSWEKFATDVQSGSAKATRVLLWHLMRREHHTLRFEDTPDFYTDELVIEHSAAELREIRSRVVKSGLPAADIDQALAVLDARITEAEDREDTESGKATSNTEL